MTAFATVDDVSALLRRELTLDEVRASLLMLDGASASIRAYTRQTITAVANDPVILRGTWSHRLTLPERPVTAVTAVVLGVTTLVADVDYTWPGKDDLLRGAKLGTNMVEDLGRADTWGGPDAPVHVTYSHGYAVAPDDVVQVCLDMIERRFIRPSGVIQEHIGTYRVQYDPLEPSGMQLSPGDKDRLRHYRRTNTIR